VLEFVFLLVLCFFFMKTSVKNFQFSKNFSSFKFVTRALITWLCPGHLLRLSTSLRKDRENMPYLSNASSFHPTSQRSEF
jgi:hypothetical protein